MARRKRMGTARGGPRSEKRRQPWDTCLMARHEAQNVNSKTGNRKRTEKKRIAVCALRIRFSLSCFFFSLGECLKAYMEGFDSIMWVLLFEKRNGD